MSESKFQNKEGTVADDQDIIGENDFWQKLKQKIASFQTIKLREKIFFVQNLRIMIKGGLSLGQALQTIIEQTNNSLFKKILSHASKKTPKTVLD